MIIGITGKSGSGKTTVSNKLNKDNTYLIIDVDKIPHDLIKRKDVRHGLISMYGENILPEIVWMHDCALIELPETEEIDRKKLGEKVFSSKEETDRYNQYIWLFVKEELEKIIVQADKDIILEWSLLPLTEYLNKCDIKVLVKSELEIRMERILKRDKITEEYFTKREEQSLVYNELEYDIILRGSENEEIEKLNKYIREKK